MREWAVEANIVMAEGDNGMKLLAVVNQKL